MKNRRGFKKIRAKTIYKSLRSIHFYLENAPKLIIVPSKKGFSKETQYKSTACCGLRKARGYGTTFGGDLRDKSELISAIYKSFLL